MTAQPHYRGRFAPSPTGALHAGSLVAALASWLDARAHQGNWLVRVEDVDRSRCIAGLDEQILAQLCACGMQPDESPVWQSQRGAAYQSALDRLIHEKRCYPCACSRKDLASAGEPLGLGHTRHGELVYPGTCRDGLRGQSGRSWRLHTGACGESTIYWNDRRLGAQFQDVQKSVGDFVLFRADACFAYQLAVVVDDAAQGITHVVRGQDLCDNTARQILLQRALGLHQPIYLHTPLVFGADGQKLSKQNGATPVDTSSPARALLALRDAAAVLGLGPADSADSPAAALRQWTQQWRESVVTAVPA